MGTLSEDYCTWTIYDEESDTWCTDCGFMFEFSTGGPEQNEFKYCPFCGIEIIPEAT